MGIESLGLGHHVLKIGYRIVIDEPLGDALAAALVKAVIERDFLLLNPNQDAEIRLAQQRVDAYFQALEFARGVRKPSEAKPETKVEFYYHCDPDSQCCKSQIIEPVNDLSLCDGEWETLDIDTKMSYVERWAYEKGLRMGFKERESDG